MKRLIPHLFKDGHTEVRVIALDGTGDAALLTGLPVVTCHYGGCNWGRMLSYAPAALPNANQESAAAIPRPALLWMPTLCKRSKAAAPAFHCGKRSRAARGRKT